MYEAEHLFRLLAAYDNEIDATVWQAMDVVLEEMDNLLRTVGDDNGTAIYERFLSFASRLVTPAVSMVGWESSPSDDHLGKLRRASVIALAGAYSEDPSVAATALDYFKRICADPDNSAACASELRNPILQIAARHGGASEHAELLRIYSVSRTDADRKGVMLAVGHVPDIALKKATLDWALSGDVKLQDCFYPFFSVSESSFDGLQCCWDYFRSHFDVINAKVGNANAHMMESFISAGCGTFADQEKADEVQAFFSTKSLPSNQRFISQMIENIRTNAAFLQRLLSGPVKTSDFFDKLFKD